MGTVPAGALNERADEDEDDGDIRAVEPGVRIISGAPEARPAVPPREAARGVRHRPKERG